MKVLIRPTSAEASSLAANHIIQRINTFVPTPSHPNFVLGLPTGSSPVLIYASLVSAYKAGLVSFSRIITFNMDEYVNLPVEHPESYHSFMYRHFFAHIDIDPHNVHILDGNAPDLAAECAAYEAKIAAAGGIDLFLGGIGPDGHIAFNEPGSSLRSRTRVKTLAADTVRANARFFEGDETKVPKQALTVGVKTVLDAREVLVIVLGAAKATALKHTIEGGVCQMWTASALQMHDKAVVVCDDDATGELLVKTVKYFQSIEQEERAASNATTHNVNKVDNWRGALRKLKINTDEKKETDQDDGELTPDSMSSRLVDSAIGLGDKQMDDFVFDRMSSRVSTFAA